MRERKVGWNFTVCLYLESSICQNYRILWAMFHVRTTYWQIQTQGAQQ